MALTIAACGAPASPLAVRPVYDSRSRQLVRLDADQNRDRVIDTRTYMAGNTPLRTEADSDQDGRVDRWEYTDAHARVYMIGTSSRRDGVEDRWAIVDDRSSERTLLISRQRDRRLDRREVFLGDVLVRAEEDGNGDGRPDKWEVWDRGVLREVRFDSAGTRGRPDRRLLYDAAGRFERLEVDVDGDGRFETPAGNVQPDAGIKP
jgi:hypothetical protein